MCSLGPTHGAGRLPLSGTTASSVRSIHLSSAATRAGAAAAAVARGAAAARPPLPLRRCCRRHCTARCAGAATRLLKAGAASSRSWAQPAGKEPGRTGVSAGVGLRTARQHGSQRSCMHIAMRVLTLQLGERASHDWARSVVGAVQSVSSRASNCEYAPRSQNLCAEQTVRLPIQMPCCSACCRHWAAAAPSASCLLSAVHSIHTEHFLFQYIHAAG